jgi:pimeloyl-ACP methyl ester carboxylesterase
MTTAFVQTRDLRMHYRQQGTGEPVLFIHGFPETSYEWRFQLEALSDSYACFAPDTRGFGETDKPGIRVTRQLLGQDIINFMDALGIERAALVGHDWGGIIAFKAAIDWPERFSRIALLDTLCTTWSPVGAHGYWFKAEPYPEEFFAAYHREFIELIFTGGTSREMPGRPLSPWGAGQRAPNPARWATEEDVAHYRSAFADPMSHFHAIQYYRYALPFHIVTDDPSATHGERYEFLPERRVAEMWTHPGGLDKHPLFEHFMDYGPEDRHKRFQAPALWMYAASRPGGTPVETDRGDDYIPRGNPFALQFHRYFPDLRARRVGAGHFFAEEAPETTTSTLRAFLAGSI